MVPHLTTALTGPINELEQRILESMPAIERWFRLEWMEHTPPFYTAVDLRNAGFKLSPVDCGLFPRGFHNLTPEMLPLAVQAAMAAIEKICPEARNLLLVPEPGVTNSFYLMHLRRLVQIFTQAGLNVRLGTLEPGVTAPRTLALPDGGELVIEPMQRARGRVGLRDFDPCTILLNHDLSGGVPDMLASIHTQYLLPPLHAGWGVRRMSRHFRCYDELAKKFAKLLGMDPWLINPIHAATEPLRLTETAGIEALQTQVDALLGKVRRKYKEFGINERPFVVLRADDGAPGLGVLAVRDARELQQLPHRLREHSGAGAGPASPQPVLVQEGVPTFERINDAVAEPVVYMIDRYVVGGFYRVHAEVGPDEVLSAPGSAYVPLAFAENHQLPRPGAKPGASAPNRFYMYGVVARLAMLAAAYELEATDPEAEADAGE
jgi:glutamate--cysteine ligase